MYGDADFLPVVLGTNLNTYNIARSLHEAYGVRTLALGRAALRETASSAIVDVRTFPDLDEPDRGRTALMTAIELRTMSWWPCASSQSSVADALRAPSTEPELITTNASAFASTAAIAECIKPVPQSVSTRL